MLSLLAFFNILPSSSISSSSSVAQEQKHLTEQVIPQIRDIPADDSQISNSRHQGKLVHECKAKNIEPSPES